MASPGRKPLTGRSRSKSGSAGGVEYIQIGLTLPRFYLDVLESDANFLGIRRAQVLEFILLRKLGLITATRVPGAPSTASRRPTSSRCFRRSSFLLMRRSFRRGTGTL